MARTVSVIHQSIMDGIAADTTLNAQIYSTSKTAIYRLFAYIIAVVIWMHETLYDEHKAEVNAILDAKQTHNRQWYSSKAKEFRYGDALVSDTDYYGPFVQGDKIVTHAAVDEVNGTLIMKVAKTNGDDLEPLSIADPNELLPFTEYMNQVKDAGVKIIIISDIGDDLKLVMDIFYDPLVLDGNGKLLSNSSVEPVKDTIKAFIKSLPFNGLFVPASLVDSLQATNGIDIPVILTCQTKYSANEFTEVDGKVIPYSGYLTIADENLTLNYRANV